MQILDLELSNLSDSLYIRFSNEPISHSFEWSGDIIFDLTEDNTVVGVDIQHLSELKSDPPVVAESEDVAVATSSEPAVRLQLVSA